MSVIVKDRVIEGVEWYSTLGGKIELISTTGVKSWRGVIDINSLGSTITHSELNKFMSYGYVTLDLSRPGISRSYTRGGIWECSMGIEHYNDVNSLREKCFDYVGIPRPSNKEDKMSVSPIYSDTMSVIPLKHIKNNKKMEYYDLLKESLIHEMKYGYIPILPNDPRSIHEKIRDNINNDLSNNPKIRFHMFTRFINKNNNLILNFKQL